MDALAKQFACAKLVRRLWGASDHVMIGRMGHWEQIGEENRERRESQELLPRWRRLDWFGYAMIVLAVGFWIGVAFSLLKAFGVAP